MATKARKRATARAQPPADDIQAILDLDALGLVARLNQPDGEAMIATLTPDQAQTLVDRLKEGADRHWSINPNRSLEMADTIIMIGAARGDVKQRALGLMARGDALKLLGHSQEAWDTLEAAGELFRTARDEVGWARTRIGRLVLSVYLDRVEEALADGKSAEKIFTSYHNDGLLIRLNINTAIVYECLGQHQSALDLYQACLEYYDKVNTTEREFLGLIYTNIGNILCGLRGDYHAGIRYFQLAAEVARSHHELRNTMIITQNIALASIQQGQYSIALRLLTELKSDNIDSSLDSFFIDHLMVECYMYLNRYPEAYELAQQVVDGFHSQGNAEKEAHALLQVASIEASLNKLEAAKTTLNASESIFQNLGAKTWIANTRLRRGRIQLNQGDYNSAQRIVNDCLLFFQQADQQVHYANCLLLQAEIFLNVEEHSRAKKVAQTLLSIAKKANIPMLRYHAHSVLGRIAKEQKDFPYAIRRFQAAIGTVEHMQQGMIISLRTGFMEDKNEAAKQLILLYLHINDEKYAFETLERAKSHAFFEYIANRQLLRWPQNDPECRDLIAELDRLRDEHHWWYQKLHGEPKDDQAPSIAIDREDVLREVATRERRMRAITEQLYLHSSANAALNPSHAPRLQDIQAALDVDTLLIAYYQDGESVWAFAADRRHINAQALPITAAKIERDINFLQLSIDRALTQGASLPAEATAQAQRILKRLYDGLLAPLGDHVAHYRRLIIVPYGHLHYLPFHLLHTGAGYLIEAHEVIVEPAASYLVQRGPERDGGARVIAHSWAGALPSAPLEGQTVHDLFAGDLFQENMANRQALTAPPMQILHIAAHAEYRLDQPDLSYIELADGQLRTDDLLQQDLSYELVTLSACETGRAYVAASDELIGLGRGFLYAGAGALVASLWRVADAVAQRVMTEFYQALRGGASKAAALRHAQRAILAEQPDLHPAFWGAFQLVGDPRPLSHSEGEPL